MGNKDRQEYKVPVTKEKLLEYMNILEVIKVVPLKDEKEPIIILKTSRPAYGLLGVPDEVVIHKGYFILSRGVKRIKGGSKTVSCLSPREVNYPNKFEISYPSKEFLIKNILDNKIQIKGSDIPYIRLARDLLREYKCLKDKRGSRFAELIKERNQVILQECKELSSEKKRNISAIIKKIKEKLKDYAEGIIYSNKPKEAKIIREVFGVKDTQIWRVMRKFHKK